MTSGRTGRADLLVLLCFFLIVLGIENLLVILWTYYGVAAAQPDGAQRSILWSRYAVAMLCSGGASFAGGLLGFLFGIPRSAADGPEIQGRPATTGVATAVAPLPAPTSTVVATQVDTGGQHPRLRANTNLESISDGVTKALLGIGLTQLYKFGDWTGTIATALGPEFGPGRTGQVVAIAVLVYGAGEGFFFGYLATRIYLTGVFRRNDGA